MDHSPLGSLSAELRVRIADYVLDFGGYIVINFGWEEVRDDDEWDVRFTGEGLDRINRLALLSTCKLLRKECKPSFFKVNRFEISADHAFRTDEGYTSWKPILEDWLEHPFFSSQLDNFRHLKFDVGTLIRAWATKEPTENKRVAEMIYEAYGEVISLFPKGRNTQHLILIDDMDYFDHPAMIETGKIVVADLHRDDEEFRLTMGSSEDIRAQASRLVDPFPKEVQMAFYKHASHIGDTWKMRRYQELFLEARSVAEHMADLVAKTETESVRV